MLGATVVSWRLTAEEIMGDPSLLLGGVPIDIAGRTSLTLECRSILAGTDASAIVQETSG